MADDPIHSVDATSRVNEQKQIRQDNARERLLDVVIRQEAAQEVLQQATDNALFNPFAMRKKFQKLDERSKPGSERGSESKTDPGKAEAVAKTYAGKNPELNVKTLMSLLARCSNNDDADSLLQKLRETYADPSLADDALDFMIDSVESNSTLKTELQKAKSNFNELYGREIRAGKNIAIQAREFSEKGLGSPTALRDLYREIITNPREPNALFDELSAKFPYKQMKAIIDFVLHSLGSDLKAKGPSIPRGELSRLFTESQVMQSFLALFKFFEKRIPLISTLFEHEDLVLPATITFEFLAKQLMRLLNERYPTPEKIRMLANQLGISKELAAQIIIFTQYRDAMRNISPRLFKSGRHREDLLLAIIEALSDLEDDLEEEEEEEEEEKK